MIHEFSSPDDIQEWSIIIFWEIVDSVPEAEGLSDLLLASIGVRAIRRASRRWDPEKLSFLDFLRMGLREEFLKAANENRFTTAAEDALALVNRGRR